MGGGVHQRGGSKLWSKKWLHCNFEKNFENKKTSKKFSQKNNFTKKWGGTIILESEVVVLFGIRTKKIMSMGPNSNKKSQRSKKIPG